ncbi:MAG: metallophosphoesterase family protein, partial [Lachnospiraceae bacterium]|nr:metallophosphoesterase family protein [Lachnospiraceae bacterium]
RLPKNVILKIKGHKLFLSHGVGYMGEYSLGEMRLTAENNGCDVIAMGHTHKPLINEDKETGVTCINPGSIKKPRQYPAIPSYLVMNVRDDNSLEFVSVMLN